MLKLKRKQDRLFIGICVFYLISVFVGVSLLVNKKDTNYILEQARTTIVTITKEYSDDIGTGFLISEDGYLLTNKHVVGSFETVEVTFANDVSYLAQVVDIHLFADVALLKIHSGGQTFDYLELDTSDSVILGTTVMSLGSGFGLEYTASQGIVNYLDRNLTGLSSDTSLIQIDNHINQGMSGGPTFNEDGKVIGINTCMISPTRDYKINVGISFVTPIKYARDIIR